MTSPRARRVRHAVPRRRDDDRPGRGAGDLNEKVVAFALEARADRRRRRVHRARGRGAPGRGGEAEGAVVGRGSGHAQGRRPGDILVFEDAVLVRRRVRPDGAVETLTYNSPHHVAVVSGVRKRGRRVVLSVLQQNVGFVGKEDPGQRVVREDIIDPAELKRGTLKAYRPTAAPARSAALRDGSEIGRWNGRSHPVGTPEAGPGRPHDPGRGRRRRDRAFSVRERTGREADSPGEERDVFPIGPVRRRLRLAGPDRRHGRLAAIRLRGLVRAGQLVGLPGTMAVASASMVLLFGYFWMFTQKAVGTHPSFVLDPAHVNHAIYPGWAVAGAWPCPPSAVAGDRTARGSIGWGSAWASLGRGYFSFGSVAGACCVDRSRHRSTEIASPPCTDASLDPMDPATLQLLKSADDPVHCEARPGFDWDAKVARVRALKSEIEGITGGRSR